MFCCNALGKYVLTSGVTYILHVHNLYLVCRSSKYIKCLVSKRFHLKYIQRSWFKLNILVLFELIIKLCGYPCMYRIYLQDIFTGYIYRIYLQDIFTGYIFSTWIETKDKKTNVGTKNTRQWMFIATETVT